MSRCRPATSPGAPYVLRNVGVERSFEARLGFVAHADDHDRRRSAQGSFEVPINARCEGIGNASFMLGSAVNYLRHRIVHAGYGLALQ